MTSVKTSVRLCGDYRVPVNKASVTAQYPISKIEELYNKMAGGQTFTELDLSHAYEQVELENESKEFVTINTHRGLYQYNRLPYDVASCPAMFQSIMEKMLTGIPNVAVYLDNILITCKTDEEHVQTLETVFDKLKEANVRLKFAKFQFIKPSLVFLGHCISEYGLIPVKDKVDAIVNAPEPSNTTELKSFLGMINFYRKYLRNLATVLDPLTGLLKKGSK